MSNILLEKASELTPVQEVNGVLFKRDDLFTPFGEGNVNGGKLRQGIFLVSKAKAQGHERILTGSSLISPQSPMVAAVAQQYKMPCVVFYGGTKEHLIFRRHMPRLTKYFGAEIRIAKSGRANVLRYTALKFSEHSIPSKKDFLVLYGMNSKDPEHLTAFYETTAQQVQNLPDHLDHLAITCGSGITSAGVLYGLKKYSKKIDNIWLLGTAPNRKRKVEERLNDLTIQTGINCWDSSFNYIDLFGSGVSYEKAIKDVSWGGINFHPHYEAKSWVWFGDNLRLNNKTLFWIVGSEPTFDPNSAGIE